MTGTPRSRRTHRHRILWCVLALLWLCQQAAFAAAVCAVSMPGMATAATSASQPACVNGMSVHAKGLACAEHCAQGTLVQSDARSPKVPGSLLPPLAPAAPTVAMLPRAEVSFAPSDQGYVYRPPLRLLYCSLLI